MSENISIKPNNYWLNIQYLRAIAAMMVVFHHARNPESWLYNPIPSATFGQAGVDIFFVISGFIIYNISRDEAVGEFSIRRCVRVIPLYWCATLISLPFFYRRELVMMDTDLLSHVLFSLFFIPHYNMSHPTEIWPVLVPGWTLNYEMFFYALFAFALWRGKTLQTLLICIPALVIAGLALKPTSPPVVTYTDPIMLEFLAGVLIARYRNLLSSSNIAWLLPIGFIVIVAVPTPGVWRLLAWGLPAAGIVAGAIAWESRTSTFRNRPLRMLGDASYSIYLVHPIAIAVVAKVVQMLPLTGPLQFAAMFSGSVIASALAGIVAHYVIERRLTRALNRRLLRSVRTEHPVVPVIAAKTTATES